MTEVNPIERNDVDISKLFAWGNKFTLNYIGKSQDIYIRVVGDADLNRCRIFALRKSAEQRRKLLDYNSDERMALIADYQAVTKENLTNALILYSKEEYTSEAIDNVNIKQPKELLSDATLEQQELYQKEVDEYPQKREKAILDYISKKFESKKKELDALSKRELYDRFSVAAINESCRNEFLRAYRSMCAFFGTYKDSEYKDRLFSSYDEFDNLPTQVKAQVIEDYISLEIEMSNLKA
jgi:hypothetical protein